MHELFKVRKRFKFECAHKLNSSYSKCCQNVHGHGYICDVILSSTKLNDDGMVMDFGELKDKIQRIFDQYDHSTVVTDGLQYELPEGTSVVLSEGNPTAENMAKAIYHEIEKALNIDENSDIQLDKVVVHETDTGYASYEVSM